MERNLEFISTLAARALHEVPGFGTLAYSPGTFAAGLVVVDPPIA